MLSPFHSCARVFPSAEGSPQLTLACWLFVLGAIGLPPAARAAWGGNIAAEYYTRRAQALAAQSFQRWHETSAAVNRELASRGPITVRDAGGTKAIAAAREQALRKYLAELVTLTKPSSEVAHIPKEHPVAVDDSESTRHWTLYYAKVKNGLRPHVPYKFKSNAHQAKAGIVSLSEAHIENLKDNFDILMWYRQELESQVVSGKHRADEEFKRFLDFFVVDLLKSLPSTPRIRVATGSVDAPEWELDERRLQEQLIMAYRYLVAKYQIYPEYEQFGPADRELLMTMMKIALLMGADMNPRWFHDKEVDLAVVSEKVKWKQPMVEALELLKTKSDQQALLADDPMGAPMGESPNINEPCVITIPPPKPKQAASAPQPKTPEEQKIEIIVRPKP